MKITIGIPTKNRYDVLSHTLLSIAFQTLRPVEVILVDDSDEPKDIREIPHYAYILHLFDEYSINWRVLFGRKLGQHHSHQLIQEQAAGDYIFRIDDDCVVEPNTLKILSETFDEKVGAVAPLVITPPSQTNVVGKNDITDLTIPNIQWYKWKNNNIIKEVDHLYSCFLYKKKIADYELSLSPVCHREETIFTYKIKRAGYKLLVNPNAKVWHFRSEHGGIRSNHDISQYEHDDKVFKGLLNLWNVNTVDNKLVILDAGRGDHYAFKNILPELKRRHKKITIAVCFPDIFFDEEGIDLISIQDAKNMLGNIDEYNLYKKMIDWKWGKNIVDAFEKLYLH